MRSLIGLLTAPSEFAVSIGVWIFVAAVVIAEVVR